jgi:diguanylate cyclase (GGDEF)-like protein
MDGKTARATVEAFAGLAAASAAALSPQGHLARAEGFLGEWLRAGDATASFRSPSWERLRDMKPRAGEGPVFRGELALLDRDGIERVVNGALWPVDDGFLLVAERLAAGAGAPKPALPADDLGGLGGPRSFGRILEGEVERVRRYGGSLCVALAAVDGLDAVSRRQGAGKAGEALRAFADVVCTATRKSDRVCYAGEERFMVMLPNTLPARAAAVADRIRAAFTAALPGTATSVSPSFGTAAWREGEDAAALLARAERALEAARAAGGGRAESA